jgi:hypothetical protein
MTDSCVKRGTTQVQARRRGEALIRKACAHAMSSNRLIWAAAPWIRGRAAWTWGAGALIWVVAPRIWERPAWIWGTGLGSGATSQ